MTELSSERVRQVSTSEATSEPPQMTRNTLGAGIAFANSATRKTMTAPHTHAVPPKKEAYA
eukprot:5406998-Prymnesium_polylepis.1